MSDGKGLMSWSNKLGLETRDDWDDFSTKFVGAMETMGLEECFRIPMIPAPNAGGENEDDDKERVARRVKGKSVLDPEDAESATPAQCLSIPEDDWKKLSKDLSKEEKEKRKKVAGFILLVVGKEFSHLVKATKNPAIRWAKLRAEFEGTSSSALMKLNKRLFDETIEDYGGIFQSTRGLSSEFHQSWQR